MQQKVEQIELGRAIASGDAAKVEELQKKVEDFKEQQQNKLEEAIASADSAKVELEEAVASGDSAKAEELQKKVEEIQEQQQSVQAKVEELKEQSQNMQAKAEQKELGEAIANGDTAKVEELQKKVESFNE